eukprot:CAMPEP_0172619284 /NCGR_PEP_ID=MMETSP1068-20121228/91592_1 /TAXON_ID=35684 /ORGANISM="Pseudopedinella elastica, Strain CCMP716" /LENGTH=67 /DNA_ID=CAMNT_0013425951 /DNA_START=69 /DNA_END=269 /DNA_ORIENTATION=-
MACPAGPEAASVVTPFVALDCEMLQLREGKKRPMVCGRCALVGESNSGGSTDESTGEVLLDLYVHWP